MKVGRYIINNKDNKRDIDRNGSNLLSIKDLKGQDGQNNYQPPYLVGYRKHSFR